MKYNYKTNDFKRYHCPDGNTPRIETILEMSNGDLLIATAGYGLYKISKGTDKIIKDNSFGKVIMTTIKAEYSKMTWVTYGKTVICQ